VKRAEVAAAEQANPATRVAEAAAPSEAAAPPQGEAPVKPAEASPSTPVMNTLERIAGEKKKAPAKGVFNNMLRKLYRGTSLLRPRTLEPSELTKHQQYRP